MHDLHTLLTSAAYKDIICNTLCPFLSRSVKASGHVQSGNGDV